mmetsp:Transcript_29671/g.94947  ORF Transcript_29671/g.94947 Transcript_29671/m.94947 type:complete len:226 (-) Transcript_29671:95-772(-)
MNSSSSCRGRMYSPFRSYQQSSSCPAPSNRIKALPCLHRMILASHHSPSANASHRSPLLKALLPAFSFCFESASNVSCTPSSISFDDAACTSFTASLEGVAPLLLRCPAFFDLPGVLLSTATFCLLLACGCSGRAWIVLEFLTCHISDLEESLRTKTVLFLTFTTVPSSNSPSSHTRQRSPGSHSTSFATSSPAFSGGVLDIFGFVSFLGVSLAGVDDVSSSTSS